MLNVSAVSGAPHEKADAEAPNWGAFDTAVCRKPLAFAADAGFLMGIQSIFVWKALPEAGFAKKGGLMLIDLHMNPSPQDGFIVAQDRSFLNPRESRKSRTTQLASFEHAKASAALAASCKRAYHHQLPESSANRK
jgi:hypothetical protein